LVALTWIKIIAFAFELSRVKALPELWLALDSSAGSGKAASRRPRQNEKLNYPAG